LLWQFFFKSGDSKAYIITACSELQKVPFLAQSVCDFLFVYKISREPLNGFAPDSHEDVWFWSLEWTSLKVKGQGHHGQETAFLALSVACMQ